MGKAENYFYFFLFVVLMASHIQVFFLSFIPSLRPKIYKVVCWVPEWQFPHASQTELSVKARCLLGEDMCTHV